MYRVRVRVRVHLLLGKLYLRYLASFPASVTWLAMDALGRLVFILHHYLHSSFKTEPSTERQ